MADDIGFEISENPLPKEPEPSKYIIRNEPVRHVTNINPADQVSYGGLADPQSSTLLSSLQMLRRWRRGFLTCVALGLLSGIAVTALRTPMYQASAYLEIEDLNEDFLNIKQVTPVRENGLWDALTDLQTQVKALQSANLLHRATDRLKSDTQDIEAWRPQAPLWRRILNPASVAPMKEMPSAEALASSVRARIVPQTKDIEVQVESANPRLAADLANTICNEFVRQNVESRWKISEQTGEWLDRLLKEMRAKLEHSEGALQAYAESVGLVLNSNQKSVSDDKLREIQDELSKAKADREAKQARFELVRKDPNGALPESIDDTALADYQAKLADLRRQAAEISTVYTPEYSKLKRIQAQIASLQDSIRMERASVLQRVDNDYWSAARRESLLERDYSDQAQYLLLEAEKSVRYSVLQREVDGNRQAYDAMLQRAQEATIAAGMRASNVRILDPASAPKAPFKPSLVLNSAVGAMLGLVLGSVFVLARSTVDSSLREPGDASQYLKLPELGAILHLGGDVKRKKEMLLTARPSSHSDGLAVSNSRSILAGDFDVPESVMVADCFRGVVTSVLFSVSGQNKPGVFTITSAGPGEGKTTAVANLGLAMAEVNSRVLLIDGDLRRAQLSALLGVSGRPGFLDLLQAPTDADPLTFVEPTSIRGLSILGSDRTSSAPYNLLNSSRLQRILSNLRQEFDVILIDTPPVLTAPDARIFGRIADGVILLTRSGRTTRQAAQAAYQRLVSDGSVVLGTIFNDWNPKESREPYYGYYGKPYGPAKSKPKRQSRTTVLHDVEL